MIHTTAKVSKEVNRKSPLRNMTDVNGTTFNPLHRPWTPQYTTLPTDGQTDDSIVTIAYPTACGSTIS